MFNKHITYMYTEKCALISAGFFYNIDIIRHHSIPLDYLNSIPNGG